MDADGMPTSLRLSRALTAATMTLTSMTVGVAFAPASQASGLYDNCTNLHNRWPHGVGRLHAHDHTTGTPVTTFKRSNRLYRIAMNHNAGLDRDGDKIACEAA
jgi:hypothetical protein